jgi:peptide/nickel transport system substrate-binding protein
MNTAKRALLLLNILILPSILLLSACGNQAEKNPIKSGGSVTIVPSPLGKFQCTFNPFSATGSQAINCNGVRGLIYEPLLFTNRLTGETTPWLAERYEWSKDAKVLTFHLRQHATWSDGHPFTNDDVIFTFNLLKQYSTIDKNHIWQQLQSVTSPDPTTIVMTFNAPSLLMQLSVATTTYIVPQHIWKTITDPTTITLAHPIGTGPFILSEYSPDLYVMKRNPTYWQAGKPYIDEVRFPSYETNYQTKMLLAQGSLDWAGVYDSSIESSFINLDPAHNHYWFPPGNILVLSLNLSRPQFQSLAVRQAISLTLDRNEIALKGETGFTTAASPTGLLLPGYQSYIAPEYTNLAYKQDIQKAKSLLASAGYTVGSDGILVDAAGNRLAFNLNVVDGWDDWGKDADLIASQLKAINVAVEVQRLPYADYSSQATLGAFDTSIVATNGPDPFSLFNGLLSSQQTAPIGQKALSNIERWNDSETDTLLNHYKNALTPDDQRTYIQGLQKIMVEQLPVIPLVYNPLWYEYRTTRFVGWPDKDNPYAVPSPYYAPDIEVVLLNIHLR